jgi:Icc-related predicted phosphoesterase
MRVLAAADIHGILSIYEWLVEVSLERKADLLVLAGDLFSGDWEEGQRAQAQNIIPILKQTSVPCFYLMGNDDNISLGYEDDRIRPLHGRRLSCGDYYLVGYEYTPPFVGSAFVKSETEIEADLQSLEPLLQKDDLFITHAPAYGAVDAIYGGEHVGCRALAALLARKPVLAHIHGHVHNGFGREGNHFNVACAGRKRAFLIELPSLDHEVIRGE